MTEQEDIKKEKGEGRNEAWAALAVGFICLVVGVPLWWRTTTTYRASLPYSDIVQLFQQQTTCSIPVTLVTCSSAAVPSVGELEPKLAELLSGVKEKSSLSIHYSLYSRACLTREKTSIASSSSVKELDDKLDSHQQGTIGGITVYFLDDSTELFPLDARDVYLGGHRAIFIKGSDFQKALQTTSSLLKSVIISESSLQKHYRKARGITKSVADLESMRSFRYKPGYELSFTLLVPEPHNVLAHWDMDQAQTVYLDPMLHRMRDFAEFTVTSQVLYYTGLSVTPKLTPGGGSHFFPHTSLGHIITPVEAKLGSHVTNFPNLNFVVYIPPLDQSPLYIHSQQGEPVDTNAFLSPRWGGVLIHNTPTPGENVSKPYHVDVDSGGIMPVFLAQLRLLLGVPMPKIVSIGERPKLLSFGRFHDVSPATITLVKCLHAKPNINSTHKCNPKPKLDVDGSFIDEPTKTSVMDWEYESLLRRHCIENLATASTTLFSLSQLLEKIGNIVIKDDIAQQVYVAVESMQSSHRFLRDGKLQPAFQASKRAIIASEEAFFDPSLLELLYFPDDQKFAIYIPLFLPVSIPVVMSLIKAAKWIKHNRETEKQKTD
ncbi:GPI transamidase component PIG-S-like [Diadema antillarum]|uniref:GPI transamidase component PIG-S-like n=1 Tax=Diadema antillarum TaxID=105358 RepID=UPI003A86557B